MRYSCKCMTTLVLILGLLIMALQDSGAQLVAGMKPFTTAATCAQSYTIVQGDTCNAIGAKFGISGAAIINANSNINAGCTNLQIGEVLCIPGTTPSCASKYTVVQGDTCNSIGAKFGVTAAAIISANSNNVNSGCTNLNIGEILCIPGAPSQTPVAVPTTMPAPVSSRPVSAPSAAPATVCSVKYTVVSGDTCNAIGLKFGVSAASIIQANPSINAQCTNLQLGAVLCIPGISFAPSIQPVALPPPTTPTLTCSAKYTVVSGDTCNAIGLKFGVSAAAIIQANPSINAQCTNLQLGAVLCIPFSTSAPSIKPVASPPTVTCSKKYTVVSGDTCNGIGFKFGVSAGSIIQANPSINAQCTNLQIGAVLCIPTVSKVVFPVIGWFNIGNFPSPVGTPNANMGSTLSGWTDIPNNLRDLTKFSPNFLGAQYIAFGGGGCGTPTGCQWDASVIANLQTGIVAGQIPSNYVGIGFDIEEPLNGATGLASAFSGLFAATKAKGYLVFVTVSGNAPYGFADKCTLMNAILSDKNVDFLVPQLYGGPCNTPNCFQPAPNECGWTIWQSTNIPIVPVVWMIESIQNGDLDSKWAQTYGLSYHGYMVFTPN